MPIEKIDEMLIKKEHLPIVCLSETVLDKIRDPDAYCLWTYLASRPRDWIVIRKHLQDHFRMAEKRVRRALQYLQRNGLIENKRDRKSDGTMDKIYILVKNGLTFKEDVCDAGSTPPHPSGRLPRGGNCQLIRKDLKDKIKEKDNLKDKKGQSKKLDEDFKPLPQHYLLAQELCLNIVDETKEFIDYYMGNGRKLTNWNAVFNSWLRKAKRFKTYEPKGDAFTRVMRSMKTEGPILDEHGRELNLFD